MSTDILGTLSFDGDNATVAFDRRYATTADDLWNAVTDRERLERWFARVTGDLQPGGNFVIHFDDDDTPECRIESCSAPTQFTWIWPHRGRESYVSVEVVPDGEGARLRLTHSNMAAAQAPDYGAGWDAYVRRLDSHIDGSEPGDWWPTWEQLRSAYSDSLSQ